MSNTQSSWAGLYSASVSDIYAAIVNVYVCRPAVSAFHIDDVLCFSSVLQVAMLIQYLIENTPAIFGDDLDSLFTRQLNSEQETHDYTGNCVVLPFGPH